jgi:hypothetical protein
MAYSFTVMRQSSTDPEWNRTMAELVLDGS